MNEDGIEPAGLWSNSLGADPALRVSDEAMAEAISDQLARQCPSAREDDVFGRVRSRWAALQAARRLSEDERKAWVMATSQLVLRGKLGALGLRFCADYATETQVRELAADAYDALVLRGREVWLAALVAHAVSASLAAEAADTVEERVLSKTMGASGAALVAALPLRAAELTQGGPAAALRLAAEALGPEAPASLASFLSREGELWDEDPDSDGRWAPWDCPEEGQRLMAEAHQQTVRALAGR